MPGSRRLRTAGRLLALTELGHAHWFFGNLYEAIVKVPDLKARYPETSPTGRGSPLRYYLLTAPIGIPAVLAAAPVGWTARGSRPWLVAAATFAAIGGAATAYLVRSVNLKLFFGSEPLTDAEQAQLLRTWYRVNAIRLLAAGGVWLAAHQARGNLT